MMRAFPHLRAATAAWAVAATITTTGACAQAPLEQLPSQIPAPIAAELQKIGPVVAPPPTAALYAPLQQAEPYAGVRVTRDAHYGPDPRHLLDVFAPDGAGTGRTVLVFVHGGAFIAGNKRTGTSPFYDNIMLWAARNNMVGVNMTYRLAPQHTWPAAQQDIAAALSWVRQNIGEHGGEPSRIFLMGHSAGAAHVAQYVGHTQFHVVSGGGIAGAVLLSGLFDTATAEVNPPLQAYFGTNAAQYPARSALPGMVASRLPMMFSHAELDPPDFQRQAAQAHEALCKAGRCPVSVRLLGHSHMSEVYAINTGDGALTDALREFVRQVNESLRSKTALDKTP